MMDSCVYVITGHGMHQGHGWKGARIRQALGLRDPGVGLEGVVHLFV